MLWLGVLLLAPHLKAGETNISSSANETVGEDRSYYPYLPSDEAESTELGKFTNKVESTEEPRGEPLEDFLQYCSDYLCNDKLLWSVCSCDKNCYKKSNCCPNTLDDREVEGLLFTDVWSCVSITEGQHPVPLINKCPHSFGDSTIRRLCEDDPERYSKDPRLVLPVVNPNTNITYKNVYCAQCNEGKADIRYEVRFKCNDPSMMTDGQAAFQAYLHNQSCIVDLPDKRACKDEEGLTSGCSETWAPKNRTFAELTRWRCSKVYAPVTVSGKVYRNAYCAVCHHETPAMGSVICDAVQGEATDVFEFSGGGKGESQDFPTTADSVCLPQEVYDPFRRQCRAISGILAPTMEDELIAELSPSTQDPVTSGYEEAPYEGPSLQPCKKIVLDGPEFKLVNNVLIHKPVSGCSVRYEGGEYVVGLDNFGDFAVVCASPPPNRTRSLCVQHYCSRRVSGFSSCSCDISCLLTGTCCLDVFPEEEIPNLMQQDKWDCTSGPSPVIATSKCPSSWEEGNIKRLCEADSSLQNEPLLHLPVVSESDQNVYRNIFCAKCHRVLSTTSFQTEFQCKQLAAVPDSEAALDHFLQDDGVCDLSFSQPEDQSSTIPPCQTGGCSVCPESWHHTNKTHEDLIRWKCNNYLAPAYVNGTCYKNEFCLLCNGVDPRYEKIGCGVSKKDSSAGEFSTESVLFIIG